MQKSIVGSYIAEYDGRKYPHIRSAASLDFKLGSNNPSWKERLANGFDAGSPYTRIWGPKVIRSDVVDWYWEKWKNGNPSNGLFSNRYRGAFPLWTLNYQKPNLELDIVSLQDQVALAFLSKLRSVATRFQALPFLWELRETIGMLKNPLKGIIGHTEKYRRAAARHLGSSKKAGIVADGLNDAFLQYTFAVKPLLGDIESGLAAAKDILFDSPDIPLSVTFRDTFSKNEGVRTAGDNPGTYPVWVQTWSEVKASVQIKGAFRTAPHHPLGNRGRENLGLELDEFIPAAWELLPWSFVADYFTNIGDILGARGTALSGLRWYWMGTKTNELRACICIPFPALSLPVTSPRRTPKVAVIQFGSFNRSRPSLDVDFQRNFEFNLPNLGQTFNTLSLAFGRLRAIQRPPPPRPRGDPFGPGVSA